MSVGAAAAVAAVAVVPADAAAAKPTPGAPGLGDRLYPTLGNGGYDVVRYDLALTYRKKDPKQAVAGSVRLTATATQDLSSFDLDFAGKAVGQVTVGGVKAAVARRGDELVVTPRTTIKAGSTFTVFVKSFSAVPVPAATESALANYAYTRDGTVLAGQPNGSHRLFPSNDHPRDKATYRIVLKAPRGWVGVANGVLSSKKASRGYDVWTYTEKNPMASELVQVVVGDFVVRSRPPVNGVPLRDVVPRRLASTLLPKAADEGNQLAWLESKVGPYPFENYGSLVIDARLGFALETQTLSLYDTSLFGPKVPTKRLNPVMAHELAHQWFGDSVAPRSWSDVWLNEGHATWYEELYAEKTGVFKDYTGVADPETLWKSVYALGDRWRDRWGPVARPTSGKILWDLFNPNVYYGGSLALYALRQEIGTDAFEQLEREWVTVNKGTSASTDDFIALASKVAGKDLRSFLVAWLYGKRTPPMPGHPDWKVRPVPASAETSAAARARLGQDAFTTRIVQHLRQLH